MTLLEFIGILNLISGRKDLLRYCHWSIFDACFNLYLVLAKILPLPYFQYDMYQILFRSIVGISDVLFGGCKLTSLLSICTLLQAISMLALLVFSGGYLFWGEWTAKWNNLNSNCIKAKDKTVVFLIESKDFLVDSAIVAGQACKTVVVNSYNFLVKLKDSLKSKMVGPEGQSLIR